MRLRSVLGVTALIVTATAACSDDETVAPVKERYVVALTGQAERPNPVTTNAAGSAVLTLVSPDSLEYLMYVTGDSITASHIHAGDANSSGPIIVFTFGGPVIGRQEGLFRYGFITRQTTFTGVFTYDSLMTRLRAGTSYLNVHSRRFPGGELRGQLVK
jgi:CHRD domain